MKKIFYFTIMLFLTVFTISDPFSAAMATDIVEDATDATVTTPEIHDSVPELYIKAVNPGYGKQNEGEMIELARRISPSSDSGATLFSLAGVSVRYTISSGNQPVLVKFPENSYMAGESIILRLASSPDHELAAVTYTKTIALDKSIDLIKDDEIVDSLCWTNKDGCYPKFKSDSPTTLVRDITTNQFFSDPNYLPIFIPENYVIQDPTLDSDILGSGATDTTPDAIEPNDSIAVLDPVTISDSAAALTPSNIQELAPNDDSGASVPQNTIKPAHCQGLVFSEILSYYAELQSEQFIELHNSNSEQILLDGCAIRYKNKAYPLSGIIKPEEYYVYQPSDFKLTKNPTTSNLLEILDSDGTIADTLEYLNGQKKGTAWAFIGYDEKGEPIWRTTYLATPGAPNIYQEYKTCESGKVINAATGNCVKVTEVTQKTCAADQYLNPLTGRCNKLPTSSTPTECKDGYVLNPDTGRCNKIKENNGADYSLITETYEESSSFVALSAILGVVVAGIVFLIFEFRHELVRLWRRVVQRFH